MSTETIEPIETSEAINGEKSKVKPGTIEHKKVGKSKGKPVRTGTKKEKKTTEITEAMSHNEKKKVLVERITKDKKEIKEKSRIKNKILDEELSNFVKDEKLKLADLLIVHVPDILNLDKKTLDEAFIELGKKLNTPASSNL